MTNKQRRSIVDDAKSKGYQGSYIDLFKQAVLNPSQNQDVLTADTPLEKEQGLRPLHEAGRTDASMAFKDVPPNTPFNTVGMKAPIDIKKFDEQGHLVKSYDAVPPGIQSLNTGPNKGTVLETPARMQEGGFFDNAPYNKTGPRQEIVEPYFTGDDYNYRKALESGETPSPEDGHWGSVAGDGSNVVLKSKDHPTIKHEFIPTMMDPDWKMVGDPEGFFGEDNSMKYVPRMQSGGFNVEGNTNIQSAETTNPGFLRPKFTQDFSEDMTVSHDDGNVTRNQAFETTRGNRIRGNQTFSSTDPQGNVTTQIDKYRNSRMMGLIPPRSTSKIIYPEKKQKGDYVTPMKTKEFPSNAKRAEMVNYAKEIDMAGRLNKIGANTTNEALGRGSADRGTLPLVPNTELEKAMSNKRIKAQEGSMISDFLLPALSSDNAVQFGNQQADSQAKLVTKSEQDLAAEQANVQRVRENVIPSAKNIANRWANMTDEEKKSYEDILDYAPNSSATGRKPPTNGMTRGQQTSEVRRKLADRPESLKEYMPNYNIFLDQPDKFGTNRGVYCTTMGCYAYEKAGARQITDKNGHPMRGNTQFVNATKQGVSGFEQIDAKDRQPGDLTVLRGNARSDYNDPTSVVTRDHHTVIYAGEGKREADAKSIARGAWDWITGTPEKKYDYNTPEAIKA